MSPIINPTLPTAGEDRGTEEVDVINALVELLNLVNGQLDASNIAASVFGAYRTVFMTTFRVPEGMPNATYWASAFPGQGVFSNQSIQGDNSEMPGAAPLFFGFDPADYAIAGRTTKLRLRMATIVNGTAPVVNLTGGLYPVSALGSADSSGLDLGAVVAGSTASRANPGANSENNDAGVDFNPPTSGLYALGLQLSGGGPTTAANSLMVSQLMLQARHV